MSGVAVGQKVSIHQKPLTLEDFEGFATVKRIKSVDVAYFGEDSSSIAPYLKLKLLVRFDGETRSVERTMFVELEEI